MQTTDGSMNLSPAPFEQESDITSERGQALCSSCLHDRTL